MASDSAVLADCHRIVHSIGAATLARNDGNVAKAFVEGSAVCGSGFYHGLIERAFVGVPDEELGLSLAANRICEDEEIRRVAFVAYQCVHGLGHGLMLHTGYDLPKSLRVCDALKAEFDQVSCTGGVFMENANASYGTTSEWLKDDDLIYPCNAVATRHKYYCYLLVTSRILPAVGGSLERTAEVCRQSEDGWVEECFESFGRDASGIAKQNGDEILPLCRIAGANESRLHLRGGARHREQRRRRQASRPFLRQGEGERPRPLLRGSRHDPRRAAHVRRRATRGLRGADDAVSGRMRPRRRHRLANDDGALDLGRQVVVERPAPCAVERVRPRASARHAPLGVEARIDLVRRMHVRRRPRVVAALVDEGDRVAALDRERRRLPPVRGTGDLVLGTRAPVPNGRRRFRRRRRRRRR